MSGILLVVEPDGGPDPVVLGRMLGTLAHRGPDGSELLVLPWAALGHQRFWTTPEEVGERQPLTSADGRIRLALDGRIDNREDLVSALGCDSSESRSSSDAVLFLRAYERWGDDSFGRIIGSFAVVVLDERDGRAILARDALGDRSLFYWTDGRRLVAASEPVAVLAYPGIRADLDDGRLASLLAISEPVPGATFFREVQELPIAHRASFRNGTVALSRNWDPPVHCRPRPRSDGEWAEAFVETLDRAVASRLRSTSRPAVLLSGGLDSGPIAALAAKRLAPARLASVSWVFDKYPVCDERRFSDEIARMWNLETFHVCCDDAWPFHDFGTWPLNPNGPQENLYRRCHERGYRAARAAGARVMLSGYCGDDIYVDSGDWMLDLVRDGRLGTAWTELVRETRAKGVRRAVRSWVLSPLVPRWIRRRRNVRHRPWLTPYARELLAAVPPTEEGPKRPGQRRAVFSEWIASGVAGEVRPASIAGIDVRYPFRDRRLVELALSVPSHQLHRGEVTRPVVRHGFRELLPPNVVNRPTKASFRALIDRAMSDTDEGVFQRILSKGGLSRRFVDDAWISEVSRTLGDGNSTVHDVVLWFCVLLDVWCERTLGSGHEQGGRHARAD